jgi:hypothetical protein
VSDNQAQQEIQQSFTEDEDANRNSPSKSKKAKKASAKQSLKQE